MSAISVRHGQAEDLSQALVAQADVGWRKSGSENLGYGGSIVE
jgi:hypothetical protein